MDRHQRGTEDIGRTRFTVAPARILILRALQLGDLLCAVPAWRALRSAFPTARIVLAGLPWARTFVARFRHLLDGFMEFPGYPGLPERTPQLDAVPRFLAAAQRARFDLALQMHGSGSIVNPLVSLFGAARTAGFYVPGEYCPDAARFLPYPDDLPEVHRHLRLMEMLDVTLSGDALEFPITRADQASLGSIPEAAVLERGRYVVVHPGARSADRRWHAASFGRVAAAVAGADLEVVVTGSAEEALLTRAVVTALGRPALDLAGRTDLGALAVLLRGARVLICNDTGVSHLAAALGVPSVVVFSGSELRRWAPLDSTRHRAVLASAGEAAVTGEARRLAGVEGAYAA